MWNYIETYEFMYITLQLIKNDRLVMYFVLTLPGEYFAIRLLTHVTVEYQKIFDRQLPTANHQPPTATSIHIYSRLFML